MNKPKKWFGDLFRRRIYVMFLLLLQIILMIFFIVSGSKYLWINDTLKFLSLLVSLHIIAKHDKVAYKLTWVFLILLFPLFGGLFYLIFQFQSSPRKFSKYLEKIGHDTRELYTLPNSKNIKYNDCLNKYSNLVSYFENFSSFPLYDKTETKFLSSGEMYFEELLDSLKNAKKYIFLESFIIKEGIMWNSILEILKEKVEQGVTVRVIYDDVGCFLLLPFNYPKILESIGIECVVFNKFRPLWTTVQNNRYHRKNLVIDGKVAFNGGINLGDEYINRIEKYGHWKDTAIMLTGDAVKSFTLMFLQMWNITETSHDDFKKYILIEEKQEDSHGYIMPYGDSPLDNENVGENVYMDILATAKKYVHIMTPYLIIDNEMITALTYAAKRGVDVKIILPHIPDKKYAFMLARTYYLELIKAGVKIYEYIPGFVHAKVFSCDDEKAVVGTINLDFRSLYLHFECATFIYKAPVIKDIEDDYNETLKKCKKVTLEDYKNLNVFYKIGGGILKLFAPLM